MSPAGPPLFTSAPRPAGSAGSAVVVGCGICGLSVALELQQIGYQVEIWTERTPPNTVSNVAVGLCEFPPYVPSSMGSGEVSGRDLELTYNAIERWKELPRSAETGLVAVRSMDIFTEKEPRPWWADYTENYLQGPELLKRVQLKKDHNYVDAYWYDSILIDTDQCLQWMINQFTSRGGKIVNRVYETLDEAVDAAPSDIDVIINCTGVKARDFTPDPAVFPLLGMQVRIQQPKGQKRPAGASCASWDEQDPTWPVCIVGNHIELFPKPYTDMVVFGGCGLTEDKWVKEIFQEHRERIEKGGCDLYPHLAQSPEDRHPRVGLRPHRKGGPRLAVENRKGRLVGHLYGHSGYGVTASWGYAEELVSMVQRCRKGERPEVVTKATDEMKFTKKPRKQYAKL